MVDCSCISITVLSKKKVALTGRERPTHDRPVRLLSDVGRLFDGLAPVLFFTDEHRISFPWDG